jgi:hypothetical protein
MGNVWNEWLEFKNFDFDFYFFNIFKFLEKPSVIDWILIRRHHDLGVKLWLWLWTAVLRVADNLTLVL